MRQPHFRKVRGHPYVRILERRAENGNRRVPRKATMELLSRSESQTFYTVVVFESTAGNLLHRRRCIRDRRRKAVVLGRRRRLRLAAKFNNDKTLLRVRYLSE